MSESFMWAYLMHLSYNMWGDRESDEPGPEHIVARPYLRFDDTLWGDIRQRLVEMGANTVVIDLGDGVRYESHPEIAVDGAWSVARLRGELSELRAMGLQPVPKLNFSTCHDEWMGPYARCVSTDLYYQVCRDLIAEVIDLFDGPRYFHLGMDEETAQHQRRYAYVVIRQHELWWHDLAFLVEQVTQGGARPWVWSDYVWHHPDAFYAQMPQSVLQSNWYYGEAFGADVAHCQAYDGLEAHGYDQVPTGSTWTVTDNMERTVAYCASKIDPSRLCGFMQSVWKPTLEICRTQHVAALEALGRAIAWWHRREG